MPTFNNDHISNALTSTFKVRNGSNTTSVVKKMETSISKSLLAPVQFDDPIVHTKCTVKTSYIILSTSSSNSTKTSVESSGESNSSQISQSVGSKSVKVKSVDQVPAAKITLFRKDQIEVGYRRMTGPGAGMWNMGNTCYLNSTLQALFHIPAFVNYLCSGGHDKECSISGFSSCTICIMNATFRQTHQVNIIKPSKIYEKLKFICKHLVHGRQEDAHEFLRYLIESFQRCYLISRKVHKSIDSYSKETTPFNQTFGGYLRQELHCLKCHYVSVTYQHFMDIMLDIKNADNIDSALQGYFKREVLSQEDMYKCEKCKQKVPAHKIYRIERPPLVLCLQLKRFNIMGGKNGRPVRLSQNLDLTRFVRWAGSSDLKFNYTLTSLITHVGPSPNCGHYTAIGKAPNGTYYRFDDSSVNPTSVQNVLNTSAYVIFYEMTSASRDRYLSAKPGEGPSCKSEQIIGPKLQSPKVADLKSAIKLNQSTSPFTNGKISVSSVDNNLAKKHTIISQTNSSSTKPVNNMPKLISETKKPVVNETVKTIPKQVLPSGSLVPDYGSGSSSEEDEVKSDKNVKPKFEVESKNAKDGTPQLNVSTAAKENLENSPAKVKALFSGIRTPFLPRAVAANLKKSIPSETQKSNGTLKTGDSGIYNDNELHNQVTTSLPTNLHINKVDDIYPKSGVERHGFTVIDKESHNPSIHSDNSSGSTQSFTVTEMKPGSCVGTPSTEPHAKTPASKMNWNITCVNKRDRSEELTDSLEDVCMSPSKKTKIKEGSLQTDKGKKSVLEDVKTKTTDTLRELGKDFISAGAKLKQQFEMRSNKVTDKIDSFSKNIEDRIPNFEEPSTSCEASTSQGSLKTRDNQKIKTEPEKKKKKKKKKKKARDNSPDASRSRSKERNKDKTRDKSRSRSNERSDYRHGDENGIEIIRHSSWNQAAPVKKWDQKSDRKLDRSLTWDGTKGSSFLDEIKKSSTIRSWSGERVEEERRERKRSMSPESDDEIDRGRVKKVKKKWEDHKPSHNPFQEAQNYKDKEGKSRSKDNFRHNGGDSGSRNDSSSRNDSGSRKGYFSKDRGSHDKPRGHFPRSFSKGSDNRREGKNGWDHNYHRN